MKNIAIYAGSFDPITKGHAWVIDKGLELFDKLYVAIGYNPAKKSMFTVRERADMIEDYLHSKDPDLLFSNKVEVIDFSDEFQVDIAKHIGAKYMLRGLRNSTDFGYELEIKLVNEKIAPEIETVFVVPPRNLCEVSSSVVKGLMACKGWENIAKEYVPQNVLEKLKEKTVGSH